MKLVMVSVIGTLVAGCNPFESRLVTVCEEALVKRLLSPAGYERVEVSEVVSDNLFVAYFRYDAPNSYGTPMRSLATCEYSSETGDVSRADFNSVRIEVLVGLEAVSALGTALDKLGQ